MEREEEDSCSERKMRGRKGWNVDRVALARRRTSGKRLQLARHHA